MEKTMLEKFNGASVITMNDNYILTGIQNTWDTNYHLYEIEARKEFHPVMSVMKSLRYSVKKEFLIDCDDVCDTYDELEEYGCLMIWEEFQNEENLDEIKELAWKIKQ